MTYQDKLKLIHEKTEKIKQFFNEYDRHINLFGGATPEEERNHRRLLKESCLLEVILIINEL